MAPMSQRRSNKESGKGYSKQVGFMNYLRSPQFNIVDVTNMASAVLMQARMIYHKNILSIDFGQQKWTMLYGSKVRFMIDRMV